MLRNYEGVLVCKTKGFCDATGNTDRPLVDVEVHCKTEPNGFSTLGMTNGDCSAYIQVLVNDDMKQMFEIIKRGEVT